MIHVATGGHVQMPEAGTPDAFIHARSLLNGMNEGFRLPDQSCQEPTIYTKEPPLIAHRLKYHR